MTTPFAAEHDPLHGVNLSIAQALAPHMPAIFDPKEVAAAARRADYVAALRRFDWEFELTTDENLVVWFASRDELERLRREQRDIDPDLTLWHRHAAPGFALQGVVSVIFDDYEAEDLALEDAFDRRLQRQLAAHPDPRDPDHPIDEAEDES